MENLIGNELKTAIPTDEKEENGQISKSMPIHKNMHKKSASNTKRKNLNSWKFKTKKLRGKGLLWINQLNFLSLL